MGAYSCLELDEWTGGIVFAKTKRDALRIGADAFNHGDCENMEITRRKDLDRYEGVGVPAWLLVDEGWRFECWGCGMQINDSELEGNGLPITGVVGKESGRIYCCHACRMESMADDAARRAFGEAFTEMLRDMVRDRFPGIEHNFGERPHHVYVGGGTPITVKEASVYFDFPGMKIGQASLTYRHAGLHGREIIGPVRPEYYCCSGDREAFERMSLAGRPQAEAEKETA